MYEYYYDATLLWFYFCIIYIFEIFNEKAFHIA